MAFTNAVNVTMLAGEISTLSVSFSCGSPWLLLFVGHRHAPNG